MIMCQVESAEECGGKEAVGGSQRYRYHRDNWEVDRTCSIEKPLTASILIVSTYFVSRIVLISTLLHQNIQA